MNDIENIYYQSPVGLLRLAADENGLSEIHFINESEEKMLIQEDRNRISQNKNFMQCITQLNKYFAGDMMAFNLELSFKGTPFQQKVWNALCTIPYGRTVSYMDLSKRLGDPKAIRAVGTANGKNNIAIVVPCHRVIGTNGTLVGYAGELWRKKWLLDHEAKFANGVRKLF